MLLYSTIVDINEKMTKDGFIQLVIEWNQGSPHDENIIKGISWNGEKNIRFGDDKLWLEIIEYRNKNIIAVRYEKIADDGVIWDTDYIMNFDEMRMAIRLDRSYVEEAIVTNAEFSTPHFVTLLIEKGYVKSDENLEVSRNAVEVTEENISLIADIVNGKAKYKLPVVYVSKTFEKKDPLAVNWLCSRLKGAAHILVQQDPMSNDVIRAACDDKNEYNGAIGIYYPNDPLGHKRCMYREGSEKQLLDKVVRFVLQFGILQRIDKLYTWQGVSNSLLNDRLASQRSERLEAEKAKEKAERDRLQAENAKNEAESARYKAEKARDRAESEVEKVYDSLDEELTALQRQVDELSRANDIKEYENQALRAKLAQIDEKPILLQGEEEELYTGEIKDMVLELIDEAIPRLVKNSRRDYVLRDILESNQYERLSEEKKREVKRILKGYTGMSGSVRSNLQDLGFTISEDGKHYKLYLGNDTRNMVTLSKTPSDHREGDNASATICRNLL